MRVQKRAEFASEPSLASMPRMHGGPDTLGVPLFDFSTNSNACGPCPAALTAVQLADPTCYPDPAYAVLREQLAAFHGVAPDRVVLAASASECIFRITAWVAQHISPKGRPSATVCVPPHAYGDYAQAAQAWGLGLTRHAANSSLVWCCEPASPLGGPHGDWPEGLLGDQAANKGSQPHGETADPTAPSTPVVLDCAYAPLRLSGTPSLTPAQRQHVWQLFSPNKSLGLTGVRAAYAVAPVGAESAVIALDRLAPSWPLGAHGVALLQAWVQPEVQAWLCDSLHTLRRWKRTQIEMLTALGWTCLPSDANFFCARPAWHQSSQPDAAAQGSIELHRLRSAGIKLRDTTSLGLPGHVRLGVQSPEAQEALRAALQWDAR